MTNPINLDGSKLLGQKLNGSKMAGGKPIAGGGGPDMPARAPTK